MIYNICHLTFVISCFYRYLDYEIHITYCIYHISTVFVLYLYKWLKDDEDASNHSNRVECPTSQLAANFTSWFPERWLIWWVLVWFGHHEYYSYCYRYPLSSLIRDLLFVICYLLFILSFLIYHLSLLIHYSVLIPLSSIYYHFWLIYYNHFLIV